MQVKWLAKPEIMEHNHTYGSHSNLGYAFKIGITLNLLFVIIEACYGYISNSMALVADAGHNLSDLLALAFSWIAILLSRKKATTKFTYGLQRSSIQVALLNTILLLVAVAIIGIETVDRLRNPQPVNSINVIGVASLGIVINGLTAWLFMKGNKKDLNIRSTFVHFVADALVSLGVVISGIIIYYSGAFWIDSVISFVIMAVILYSTYHLLIDSVNLSLDAVPENIDSLGVRSYFEDLPGVESVHDLHIWPLSTTETALTIHLVTSKHPGDNFYTHIDQDLLKRFKIQHVTVQVETGKQLVKCEIKCEGTHSNELV